MPQPEDLGRCIPAMKDIVELLMTVYGHGGRIHAETVIGAAAALTGEFALRATGLPLPETGYVFGDEINAILFEDEGHGRATIWGLLSEAALKAGANERDLPDIEEVVARIAAAVNGTSFPPLSVPQEHYPQEWSPNACPAFRERILAIAHRRGLAPRETAYALALATAKLLLMSKEVLPPRIGVLLATEIAFAVAKIAPLAQPIAD